MKRTVLSGNDFSTNVPSELKIGKYVLHGENGSFYLTDEMLSKGLLMLGNTGCGKTTTLKKLLDQVIPWLTSEDSMIIFDSKGDFLDRYYQPGNPNHIVVSLSEKHCDIASPWNVYHEMIDDHGCLTVDGIEIISGEIAKSLTRGMENSMQPFFSLSAADLLAKSMAAVVRNAVASHDPSQLNNYSLNSFLNQNLIS